MTVFRSLSVAFVMLMGLVMTTGAQATGHSHHGHHHGHHAKHAKVVHVVHKVVVHKVHKLKAVHHVRHAHHHTKPMPIVHAKVVHHHHRHHHAHHRAAAPKPPALVLVKHGHPGKCGTFLYYSSKIGGCADARAKA